MFYVNDEPEGNFLYTETIKLYCNYTNMSKVVQSNEENLGPQSHSKPRMYEEQITPLIEFIF